MEAANSRYRKLRHEHHRPFSHTSKPDAVQDSLARQPAVRARKVRSMCLIGLHAVIAAWTSHGEMGSASQVHNLQAGCTLLRLPLELARMES